MTRFNTGEEIEEDIKYQEHEYSTTSEPCPNKCGGHLIKASVADGADDYKYTYTCDKCGDIWS